MNAWGVSVEFIKENMSFTAGSEDPRSTLMFTMLSAFAQFERSLIKERQREGIALAKAKGTVYKGRKPALNSERFAQLREQAAAGANRTKLAKGVRHKPGNSLSIYSVGLLLVYVPKQHFVVASKNSRIKHESEPIRGSIYFLHG
jgi:DNA invertase Pin-like site-specific DNA recombinase